MAIRHSNQTIARRPNSDDVAREAGVSRTTVSYVLNDRPHVTIPEETRERVWEAVRRLGYLPNHTARALAKGHTGLVSLWVWGERSQGSYHARVERHMQTVLEPQPYQMVVNLVGYKTLRLARKKLLSPWSVDGIIAHEAAPALIAQFGDRYDADNQAAREMDRPGETVSLPVPVVCTGAYNLLEGTDRVQIDLRPGATAAMEHLLGSGRRRIAYLTDDLPNRGGDARHTAYVAGMQGAGRPREFVATENDSRVCARETVRAYIQAHGCPEALFCHNDDLAIGAYRGLCDLGFKVPQDCALVGCDGIEDTEYLEVPITTIVQPLAEMCSRAWEYLERRIREPDAPVQITVLEPKLVIRESTANAVRCT